MNKITVISRICSVVALIFAIIVISACSVTVGSFEGSTESFENTTEASGDFSEASTKFTSSTSPRGDDDDDDHDHHHDSDAVKRENTRQFAKHNFEQLRRDVAVGDGEYLAAVATILEVSSSQREEYYSRSKVSYSEFAASDDADSERLADTLFRVSKSLDT